MLSRFYLVPERNGQTDRRTDRQTDRFAVSISRVMLTRDKNNWMRLESRMEWWFSTFSANRCDWISISYTQRWFISKPSKNVKEKSSETCWTYRLFCTCRTLNTLLRISVKPKAYNTIISHTVQLILLFKKLLVFVWILLVSSTTWLQSWGRFLWATRYIA